MDSAGLNRRPILGVTHLLISVTGQRQWVYSNKLRFFFRAVQYIVQYGMGLRRDDEDCVGT